MSFGITPTGWSTKALQDWLTDLQNSARARFGNQINLSSQSVFTQLIGMLAEQLGTLSDLGQAIYFSQYPDTATGPSLDNLCALTGVQRLPASYSIGSVTFSGTPATSIPAGTIISVSGASNSKFATDATVVIGGGGTVLATVTCTATGPVLAPAGTLTVLVTPIGGVSGVSNGADIVPGANQETDAALRVRRASLLKAQGLATVASIQSALLAVPGVTTAICFENVGDVTDGNGLPPHSIQCVVGGTATAVPIATAIYNSKAAGIATFSSGPTAVTQNVADSQGVLHAIKYQTPVIVPLYVNAVVVVDGTQAPTYLADIKAAIVAEMDPLCTLGATIRYKRLYDAIFNVPGVIDVTTLQLDIIASPVGTSNIAIASRSQGDFDTSRITVA